MTFSFSIPRTSFLAAVERAEKVVGKTDVPIASNLLLDLGADGVLAITGTDLQRKAVATTTVEHFTGHGTTTLSAAHLGAVLRRGKGETVKVTVGGREAKLQVGRSNLKMPTLPASDFPDIQSEAADGKAVRFKVPGNMLARIVKACSFCMERDTVRSYLMGIHLEALDGRLVATSTDGKRAARLLLDLPEGAADMPAVTLPDTLVAALGQLAKDDEVAVTLSTAMVVLDVPGLTIASRLVDGNFPDIRRYVPAKREGKLLVDRDAAIEALRLVETFSGQQNRDVALIIEPDSVRFLSASSTAGEASDDMAADANCNLTIGFKIEFLASSLASLDGDAVEFDLGSDQDPAVLYDPADDDRLVMVLPFALTPAIMQAVRAAA